VRGDAPRDTTIVLGGLTQTSAPETESKVPVLGDIPVLRSNLLGGAYEIEDAELVILIRPTIIMGDEVE
jgi:general secretion pathway protein D